MAKRDYYDILGSKRGASDEELKKAFRQKAKESHPDRNPDDPSAEGRFKELNEAYDVLRDKDKKAAYDRYGHAAFEGGNGASAGGFHRGGAQGGPDFASAFSDVFEDLFGGFSGGGGAARNSQRATRGADLRYNLQVSLEDAYKGKQASLNLPGSVACETCNATGAEGGVEPSTCPTCSGMGKVRAQQGFFTVERTCPTCSGRGQVIKNPCKTCGGAGRTQKDRKLNVNIPAGVETGTRIRLAGEGEAGLRGGTPGDLYIFIEVAPHPIFEREAQNLFCRIPISMATATLGGELEAPTPDGGRSRVKVPAGVQTGKQLRLRGKGMPALRGAGHGDLYIELAVETPTNLSAKQKELMAEFEKQGKNNSPQTQDFFSKVKKFWDGVTG